MPAPERAATGVLLDPRRGHITINGAEGPPLVTLVDTGQRLELWSHEGAHMPPAVAREFGAALLRWADMRGQQEEKP